MRADFKRRAPKRPILSCKTRSTGSCESNDKSCDKRPRKKRNQERKTRVQQGVLQALFSKDGQSDPSFSAKLGQKEGKEAKPKVATKTQGKSILINGQNCRCGATQKNHKRTYKGTKTSFAKKRPSPHPHLFLSHFKEGDCCIGSVRFCFRALPEERASRKQGVTSVPVFRKERTRPPKEYLHFSLPFFDPIPVSAEITCKPTHHPTPGR